MVINVGLHKTGTTFLNRAVFPNLPDGVHLGKPFGADDPVRHLLEAVMYTPYGRFDADEARKKANQLLSERADGKRLATISDGRLSLASHADRYLVAERLREVFGPVTITMTLRRQQDLLSALYFQALGTGRAPVKYPDWVQQFVYHRGKREFDLLNYHVLVDAYASAFGRENVHVFLYEQLQENREAYARRLAEILGADADFVTGLVKRPALNTRMTKAHGLLLRNPVLANAAKGAKAALPDPFVNLVRRAMGASGRASGKLPPDVEEMSLEVPRRTNRQLVEEYGLPLEEHGYPV